MFFDSEEDVTDEVDDDDDDDDEQDSSDEDDNDNEDEEDDEDDAEFGIDSTEEVSTKYPRIKCQICCSLNSGE